MFLQTKHLTLREFNPSDLEALSALLGNTEVMQFSVSGPLSREQTREYLEKRILGHYSRHGFGLWAVIHTEEQRLIGYAGLLCQSIDGEDLVELGYRLDPKCWGKGFATEAARAVSRYAFEHLHLDRLIAIIDPHNTRSVRVAARLGMRPWKETKFHNIPVQIYISRRVVVVPFEPTWTEQFAEVARLLKGVFKDLDITFFHIGSTSIPGCSAKPVIDILGITPEISAIDRFNAQMQAHGFIPLGEYGMKQRRFFQRQTPPPVNLHVFENTDPEAGRHLRFCAWLRSHPALVKEYSALKSQLARQFPHDIQNYVLGKEQWIKSIDMLAAWGASSEVPVGKEPPKKNQWTQEEILKSGLVNLHLHMVCFAKYVPSLELVFEPDVTVVRCLIPKTSWNLVLSATFTEKNVHQRIAEILHHFSESDLPLTWWVSPSDSPPDLGERLLQQGFIHEKNCVGMYRELGAWNPAPDPFPLLFKRVECQESLKQFAELVAPDHALMAFELIYSRLPPVIYCGKSPVEMHIACLDDVPVASGMLLTHANVAGIYCVATHPQHASTAQAMVKHLLDLAKAKGYFIATAVVSEEALPLHEQLGFRQYCHFSKYTYHNHEASHGKQEHSD